MAAGLALVALGSCSDGGGGGAEGPPTTDAPTSTTASSGDGPVALRLVNPVSDNYKACFNTDPTAFDGRAWLTLEAVEVDGVAFASTIEGIVPADDGLGVVGDDGTEARLEVAVAPSAAVGGAGSFRVQPPLFGYLAVVSSQEALADDPLVVTLTLRRPDRPAATAEVVYQLDPAVADDPPGTLEHAGPGGRWFVDGAPTLLDWEPAPAPPPC